MVDIEIKVPSLGESESEATLVSWSKQLGDTVAEDDVLAEIESDKVTMEITAFAHGVLKEVRRQAGDTVAPGEIVGIMEAGDAAPEKEKKKPQKKEISAMPEKKIKAEKEVEPSTPVAAPPATKSTPVIAKETAHRSTDSVEERVPMSRLRRTIAKRLKEAQNTAAILTTFNEVNMQSVMELRTRYRDAFKEKHGVGLGFMSFFTRACVEGLRRFPAVNACLDGDDIIYRNRFNIGIAVSSKKGLVVPILRDAGSMTMAGIEQAVASYAQKAREGGLMPDDLRGGTFSITNGGVFGSLLSTPILNPPQSAILGMHSIQKRPVVVDDQIVIRPMMYLALSYDHRLIDGKEAVQFLVAIKEMLEYPGKLWLDL